MEASNVRCVARWSSMDMGGRSASRSSVSSPLGRAGPDSTIARKACIASGDGTGSSTPSFQVSDDGPSKYPPLRARRALYASVSPSGGSWSSKMWERRSSAAGAGYSGIRVVPCSTCCISCTLNEREAGVGGRSSTTGRRVGPLVPSSSRVCWPHSLV
jgi:hypothetical protein